MFEKKEQYKIHPEICHLNTEISDRSRFAVQRADDVFKYIAVNAKTDFEYYWGAERLHFEFDRALINYAFGMESSCLVEIYGLLEARLLESLREEFKTIKISSRLYKYLAEQSHLFDMEYFFRRMKASEIANILKKIGAINKENYKFIVYLETLRDALAHKNLQRLSQFNLGKKHVHLATIDTGKVDFNTKDIFLRAIRFELESASIKDKRMLRKSYSRAVQDAKKRKGSMPKRRETDKKVGHLYVALQILAEQNKIKIIQENTKPISY
jgi:hypothetical protein